jgi:hypothetical protein
LSSRLGRYEEYAQQMHMRHQAVMEAATRMFMFHQEMSRAVLSVLSPESTVHRDVLVLQGEIQKQADLLRLRDVAEAEPPPSSSRQHFFGNVDNPPVSPRQYPQDDLRRAIAAAPQRIQNYTNRPAVPSNLSLGARRPYGSIGGGSTTQSSPSRNLPPAPPPGPHPLSNVEAPPGMIRRHTSADIRADGWQPGMSPYSPQAPPQYPSSPSRAPPEHQRLRESLSAYAFPPAVNSNSNSRPATPPYSNGANNGGDTFGNWSWGSAVHRSSAKDSSAPPTRRGSMAHILNPSDTAERSDEDDDPRGEDERKRKRR